MYRELIYTIMGWVIQKNEFVALELDLEGQVRQKHRGMKVQVVFRKLKVVCVVAEDIWEQDLSQVK